LLNLDLIKKQHADFIRHFEMDLLISAEEVAAIGQSHSRTKQGFTHRTGKTKAATLGKVVRRKGKVIVRLENGRKHAAVLEKGSKAHTITARPGGMLRFTVGGQLMFRRSVKHPGTRAYTFLSRGRDFASEQFERIHKPRMIRSARTF
jgi:hypothetical protein